LVLAYAAGLPIEVTVAESAEQGVAQLQLGRFDLVLMDYNLPDGSGAHAVRQIRRWEQQQQLRPAAVFAMTDLTNYKSGEQMLQAGCTALLGKPISRNQFLAVASRSRRRSMTPLPFSPTM
jgi:CheY-like chemotaxis protein